MHKQSASILMLDEPSFAAMSECKSFDYMKIIPISKSFSKQQNSAKKNLKSNQFGKKDHSLKE